MTDTYNDSTGSRKKFLIPLVVLLLCAVSLTGAGYAYNSSVTGNGSADIDESFVLDIYEVGSATPITAKINAGNIDGLVFTTHKVVDDTMEMYGDFELENMTVVLYTGELKITAANLARGADPEADPAVATTTTQANVTVSDYEAEFTSSTYTVEAGAITLDFKIYNVAGGVAGGERGAAVELTDDKYVLNLNTVYQYEITITGVDGKVTADSGWNAVAFATAVLADVGVDFTFTINAEAKEA